MKIVFNLGTPVTLADQPASGGTAPMRDLHLNGSNILQEIKLYKATAQLVTDCGNERNEVSFQSTQLFATFQLAQVFTLTHKASLRGNADLIITLDDGSTTYRIVNATVQSVDIQLKGTTTVQSYRVIGGAITTP